MVTLCLQMYLPPLLLCAISELASSSIEVLESM